MSVVVTFVNYRPPARFDSLPWTEVRIYESEEQSGGTWTLIDTVALDPLDAEPTDPAYRDFTTEEGTDDELWYRVIFADADGDTTAPTLSVQNVASTSPPTVEAYGTANELARILKITAPTAAQTAAMERVLNSAALEIDAELGRTTPYDDPPDLVIQVSYERAVEHWHQLPIAFGIVGLDSTTPIRVARDTWERHAHKLAPLKEDWGLA